MKKILMGLLTLSVASLAALSVTEPENETVLFYGDQTGKIPVNMGIKSDVSSVKYVVYSKAGGPAANISELSADNEVVKLPDFIITNSVTTALKPDMSKYGFAGQQAPTIYVQKVGDNGALTDLAARGSGEDLYVKFIPSSDWTGELVSDELNWNTNLACSVSPFQFMTKAALEDLVRPIGGTIKVASTAQATYGSAYVAIALDNGHEYISAPTFLYTFNSTNGEVVLSSRGGFPGGGKYCNT